MATVNSRTEPTGGSFGPRKTLIIMVTVVGCIAILWPKVFYPMMVGPTQTKSVIKDHRGSGCCDVVLDQEETYANKSINISSQQNLFRKRNIGPTVEDSSIRQERPPHLRPDTIHPAMRERGRAIPHVGSVHSERPQSSPRIVEGRPGPIPGMRPPMGAGSHQSTKSANSMGFIMPLYTIGIVSFFIYTILKLIFKKTPATPYPEIKPDTTFRNEVFTTPDPYIKRPDIGTTKLGLISAADEQLMKIDSIKKSANNNLSKETEETDNTETDEKITEQNGHVCSPLEDSSKAAESEIQSQDEQPDEHEELQQQQQRERSEQMEQEPEAEEDSPKIKHQHQTGTVPKKREVSEDRSLLKVIPMEKRAAYEPGQHSSRPGTPAQHVTLDQSLIEADAAESKCILLDANVPQKVSLADSELAIETLEASQKRSEETPFDLNLVVVFESLSNLNRGRSLEVNVLLGSEPTTMVAQPSPAARVASPTREVVLSGMMKLSLVKLDDSENKPAGDVVLNAKDIKKGDTFGTFGPNEE